MRSQPGREIDVETLALALLGAKDEFGNSFAQPKNWPIHLLSSCQPVSSAGGRGSVAGIVERTIASSESPDFKASWIVRGCRRQIN